MKKVLFIFLAAFGVISAAENKNTEVNFTSEMERAEKIKSYKEKKDLAWHKTEYNKVLKYLNKVKK